MGSYGVGMWDMVGNPNTMYYPPSASGDTSLIPAQIRAIMAKRKAEKKDDTPMYSKEDAIKDINSGYKAKVDTAKVKMAHDQWMKHIDELGYELTKKKAQ